MSIGFFARLSRLFSGFLSLWVADVEKQHPQIAYENAIESMIGRYAKLKSATAAIVRRRDELAERQASRSRELALVASDLEAAVRTEKDDLALLLLEKQGGLEQELEDLARELSAAAEDAEGAKAALLEVEVEIRKLRAERDTMLAKMQSAEARLRVQEQLAGLSVEAELKALENVRSHIKNTIAEANLGKELSGATLDRKLAALRSESADARLRMKLEDLKAKASTRVPRALLEGTTGTGSVRR